MSWVDGYLNKSLVLNWVFICCNIDLVIFKMTKKEDNIFSVIESIYDAAMDADKWPVVLAQLSRLLSSESVGLYLQNSTTDQVQVPRFIGLEEAYIRSYDEYFAKVNPWFNAGLMVPGRVLTDRDIDIFYNEPGRYLKTVFYNDWLRKQGFRYAMGGTLQAENNIFINFTYFRSGCLKGYTNEDIHSHKILVPHLQKAVALSQRLDQVNLTKLASEASINHLPSGVVLLGESGRIIYASKIADNIFNENDGLTIKKQKIIAKNPTDNRRLQTNISNTLALRQQKKLTDSCHLSVSRSAGAKPYHITVLPVSNNLPFFTVERPVLMMVLTKSDKILTCDPVYWQIRFGLTDAELSLVKLIVEGISVKEVAKMLSIKYETARWHLKSIFQKTEVHRQSELVSLLLTDNRSSI